MFKNSLLCAVAIGACAVLTTSAAAQANPATPMATIESSAAQLCAYVDDDPTENGVIDGMDSLQARSLDEIDGALVLITAIHHVCPQHEALVMNSMIPLAEEEICTERT
jgi:hypothetical protein